MLLTLAKRKSGMVMLKRSVVYVFLSVGICCSCVLLLGLAIVAAVFLPHNVVDGDSLPPANQSATPAGNGFPQQLWPNGFDSSEVESVMVSYSVTYGYELEKNVSFYEKECSQVSVDEIILPPVSTHVDTFSYARNAFNYLTGDYPLYVSGGNSSLKYTVSANTNLESQFSGCALQLYLYNSNSPFSIFKEGLSPSDPFGEYVARSECLPVGSSDQPKLSTVFFNLSNTSLYYVGAAIYANVSVRVNISGTVLEYSVNELVAEDCSLTPTVKSCNIEISDHGCTVCVLYKSDNAFGTLTLLFDTQTTHWNWIWPVILSLSFLFSIAILSFSVCCWIARKYPHGYQQLDTVTSQEAQDKPLGDEFVP